MLHNSEGRGGGGVSHIYYHILWSTGLAAGQVNFKENDMFKIANNKNGNNNGN